MIIINPGSGPVQGASEAQAEKNVQAFITDLAIDGVTSEYVEDAGGGRFTFRLRCDDRSCYVDMPGIPVERVRYLGTGDQNIWDFPRLYVDGSSWVWCYGLGIAAGRLTDDADV